MNQEIKKQWIAALLSGDYEQGKAYLHTQNTLGKEDKFCCLGVLCDLAVKAGVIPEPKKLYSEVFLYGALDEVLEDEDISTSFNTRDDKVLPFAVGQWAGLDDPNPAIGGYTLAYANDKGGTFTTIAKLIEKNL